jgi:hypothetical protein
MCNLLLIFTMYFRKENFVLRRIIVLKTKYKYPGPFPAQAAHAPLFTASGTFWEPYSEIFVIGQICGLSK